MAVLLVRFFDSMNDAFYPLLWGKTHAWPLISDLRPPITAMDRLTATYRSQDFSRLLPGKPSSIIFYVHNF